MPMLSGIDLNPRSAIEAGAATPTGTVIAWKTGDVFDQAPEPEPDFVVSSQFAHHLTDDQVVAFLLWLERNSRRGWFIADLHRHALPYYGFRLLCRAQAGIASCAWTARYRSPVASAPRNGARCSPARG